MDSPPEFDTLLRAAIAERVGEARSHLWFGDSVQLQVTDGALEIAVPNQFFSDWIQCHFSPALREAAIATTGHPLNLRFTIRPNELTGSTNCTSPNMRPRSASIQPATEPLTRNGQGPINHLEDFVVGSTNQLAHSAAVEFLRSPGQLFNPLLIYGTIGLGKSFLLTAIHNDLRRQNPRINSIYITAEDFTNAFLEGMRLGSLSAFRGRFRRLQALIVDDIQFLAAKRATQDEFLHTFNSLLMAGTPIVLAADRHPKLIPKVTSEVISRLLGGMTVKLDPPDLTTRLAILEAKARQRNTSIPEPVLALLASHICSNIRELEGALCNVITYAHLTTKPIDVALARAALRDTIRLTVQTIQLEDVERVVCQFFELTPQALKSEGRSRSVTYPRMLAMFLARKHTDTPYAEIGRYFGGRNHSTVIAAEKKLRSWLRNQEHVPFLPGMESVAGVLASIEHLLQR